MAPVAARLALGLDPERLGPPLDRLTTLDWPQARPTESRIYGAVIEIDAFGNLITNITADMLLGRPTDRRACSSATSTRRGASTTSTPNSPAERWWP